MKVLTGSLTRVRVLEFRPVGDTLSACSRHSAFHSSSRFHRREPQKSPRSSRRRRSRSPTSS